jgi:cation transport ATPase
MEADSEEDALQQKEKAELAYYKRLMRETTIALFLGVPLMIYSFVVGDMTVTKTTERVVWLVIGLLTLGVMVVSGKHFYVDAWQSFKNHSANMDTLIALGTGTASPVKNFPPGKPQTHLVVSLSSVRRNSLCALAHRPGRPFGVATACSEPNVVEISDSKEEYKCCEA